MLRSILVLGRQPALGLAELESLYGAEHVSSPAEQIAALDIAASEVDFARLGGSTRLATFLSEVPSKLWKDVEKELARLAPQLATELPEGKIRLGLTAIGIPVTPQKLVASGLTLKKVIRTKTNRSVRLVPNTEPELNTAQVLHNQLTGQTGIEFLVVATSDGKTIIARTTQVQDIDSYTQRDRGRPKRDARVGMLPPKLAQVLVNLAAGQLENEERRTQNAEETAANSTFDIRRSSFIMLDPFCGTGVALQEAMLMGYSVYGTDLEPRMIDYSHANLDWLIENADDLKSEILLEAGDATTYRWNPVPDFVAGETYLGRPFTEKPSAELVAKTASEVNLILKKFLHNLAAQIPSGTRLCLAVPAWNTQPRNDSRLKINEDNSDTIKNTTAVNRQSLIINRFRHLPLVDSLEEIGYNRTRFEHVRDEDLLYYREDQVVARQLLVLQKD